MTNSKRVPVDNLRWGSQKAIWEDNLKDDLNGKVCIRWESKSFVDATWCSSWDSITLNDLLLGRLQAPPKVLILWLYLRYEGICYDGIGYDSICYKNMFIRRLSIGKHRHYPFIWMLHMEQIASYLSVVRIAYSHGALSVQRERM